MTSHVLSVGQCSADDYRIARMLQTEADAHLDRAANAEEALRKVGEKAHDLVLVNRVIDTDGSSGVDLVSQLKAAGATVMLVSDYADAQAAAVANGALQGFGKSALGTAEIGQLMRQTIHSAARAGQPAIK